MNEFKRHLNESKIILKIFLKWFLLASISGVAVGIIISFFLNK